MNKSPDYDKIYGFVHSFYLQQILLIKDFYEYQYDNFANIANERVNSLYHLVLSIYLTGYSINLLAQNNLLGEAYILSRSMLEKIINYLYILSCDENEYKNYLNYTKQKGYIIHNRTFTAGSVTAELKWSAFIDLERYPELREAVDQFTSHKGKTITRWTSRSIAERLAVIENAGLIRTDILVLATLGIYDNASEALHGTLYGATFQYGLFESKIPSNVKEFTEIYRSHLLSLLIALSGSVNLLFSMVSKSCSNVRINDLANKSLSNLTNFKKSTSEFED